MPICRLLSYCLIVPALAALYACAVPGSYVTSRTNGVERVYRYDQGGKKVLVYEMAADGKLTVYDPNDSRAKMMLGHEQRQKEAAILNVAHIEKIRQAPKRKPNDPIYLNIEPIQDEMGLNDKQKKDMLEYFRKQFENDPIIRLVGKSGTGTNELRKALKSLSAGSTRPDADVNLVITVSTDTVYGLRKGKLAEAKAMVFKAKITGNWIPAEQKAQEMGTLFEVPDATRKLSDKVKQLIKNEIGPTIPADRSL